MPRPFSYSKVRLSWAAVFSMGLLAWPPQAPAQTTFDPVGISDEFEDDALLFQNGINGSVIVLDNLIAQTRQGKNLSDMTLGMFVLRLLGTLGSQDTEISKHLHAGDRFIEGYLTDVFQFHSETEIAFFMDLAKQTAIPKQMILRESTANALDVLRNIPNGKSSQSQQNQDRLNLIKSLTILRPNLAALLDKNVDTPANR